jgi:hypothetical protein
LCELPKIASPYLECCHKKIFDSFGNAILQIAPFDPTMTTDDEPRQPQQRPQQRQQTLSHALSLSLLRGGPNQPDPPGSGSMPGLQPRARLSPDEERAYLLSTIEQVLVMMSGVDDDASIFVSLPSVVVSPASNNDDGDTVTKVRHQD